MVGVTGPCVLVRKEEEFPHRLLSECLLQVDSCKPAIPRKIATTEFWILIVGVPRLLLSQGHCSMASAETPPKILEPALLSLKPHTLHWQASRDYHFPT